MKRPVSAVGYIRPLSQHARMAMLMQPDVRYKVCWHGSHNPLHGTTQRLRLQHSLTLYNDTDELRRIKHIASLLLCLHLFIFPSVFQAENILLLELDLPTRTTKDYEGPVIAPKVAAALEDALREEDEIQVDASCLRASLGASPGLNTSAAVFSKKPKSGWEIIPSTSSLLFIFHYFDYPCLIYFFVFPHNLLTAAQKLARRWALQLQLTVLCPAQGPIFTHNPEVLCQSENSENLHCSI